MAILCGLAAMIVACTGTERSIAAFCDTYESESRRLANTVDAQINAAGGADPFTQLFAAPAIMASLQGEIVIFFDKLEAVSPEAVRADVAFLEDSARRDADALTTLSPLSIFGAGLVGGLQATGPAQRVDAYYISNCR